MDQTASQLPMELIPIIVIAAIWNFAIKGVALYRAGALRQKGWFLALLVVNTFGILEVIYLTTRGKIGLDTPKKAEN